MEAFNPDPFSLDCLVDTFVSFTDGFFLADPSTEAHTTNSRGDAIRLNFQRHKPPRPSRFRLSWSARKWGCDQIFVVAAHRGTVLFQMTYPIPDSGTDYAVLMHDYFLYRVGAGGSSLSPSLDWIPPIDGGMAELRAMIASGRYSFTNQRLRRQDGLDIAVLCRGEDFAVAELQIDVRFDNRPELHVFKSSGWEVKHPQIITHGNNVNVDSILLNWHGDKVFPLGSYLCWVDYCVGGMFLSKVLDEDPVLEFLLLPAILPGLKRDLHGRSLPSIYHTLSMDEEHCIVKFVMVTDGDGKMIEHHFSRVPYSFMVKSWTLTMEEMSWNSEYTVTSKELLGPHGFAQLPPTGLFLPIVSMDDPRTVYFACLIQRAGKVGFRHCDMALVAIDMVKKALKSSPLIIEPDLDDLSADETHFTRERSMCFESLIMTQIPKYLDGSHKFPEECTF